VFSIKTLKARAKQLKVHFERALQIEITSQAYPEPSNILGHTFKLPVSGDFSEVSLTAFLR